jgi:hypothetical protein
MKKIGDTKKANKMAKVVSCLVVFAILMTAVPVSVMAELPRELIEERNSRAEEVLVGTVFGIYNAPSNWVYPHENSERLKYFNLRIEEVQKTAKGLEKGDVIKVVFVGYGPESGIPIGTTQVKVSLLEKIKIYANPTNFGDEIFEPVIDGRSIEHLGCNYYYLIILGAVIGIIVGSIYLTFSKIRNVKIGGEKL